VSDPDPYALRRLAVRAAEAAGAELRRRYGQTRQVDTKTSATDPVSDADRASEELITALLLDERPGDGLLGEEGADHPGDSGIRWVVDPLDGTVNYLYGYPAWAVSVACEQARGEDWEPIAGAVYDPVRQETFHAVAGGGAWLGEQRLAVNEPVALDRALVATGFGYDPQFRARQGEVVARLLPTVRDIRRAGSAALDLCWLAAGRVDAFYEDGLGRWDWAAGRLLALEAGAVLSRYGAVGWLAAGPALHDDLRAALAAVTR
jgi:myo-inositol-1(or 4)-monophosphatase